MARSTARSKPAKAPARARRKPKQERARVLVDAILTATAQLLRELGAKAVTTNKVAARAGVSVGSLYQYFPNKTALFTAVAERHALETEQAILPLLDRLAVEPPEELVDTIVEALVALERVDAVLHAELMRLSLWGQTSGVIQTCRRTFEAHLADLLARRAADLPRPLDPTATARVLVRAMGGVFEVCAQEPDEGFDDALLTETLTRMVAGTLGY